jgi:hypothetical protein
MISWQTVVKKFYKSMIDGGNNISKEIGIYIFENN